MTLYEMIEEVEAALVRSVARSVARGDNEIDHEDVKVTTLIEIHEQLCRLRRLEK